MDSVSEIKDSIDADRSKKNIAKIVQILSRKPLLLEESMSLVDSDLNIAMRYTWMLSHLAEIKPEFVKPFVSDLFNKRDTHKIKGFQRSLCKIMTYTGVPNQIEGIVVDQIFDWCLDPKVDVAVKVYGITVIANLTDKYPDLTGELKRVIEDQFELNSVAFKARAKKVLQKLDKKNSQLK